MIKNLYIKDFAIIEEIDLPLRDGLTVITGETGAGKSIILQALSVCLGGKTTKTMIRSTSDKAVVESAVSGRDYRRILNKSGRAKSFINDEPINEGDFRNACSPLVDFHGQHEQQFIMNESSHIDYLDSFCGLTEKVNECSSIFNSIKKDEDNLAKLITKKEIADQQIELMNFQLNEIQEINPLQDEDVELENELIKLKHFNEIVETVKLVTQSTTDDDNAIYNNLSIALKDIERLENIDSNFKEYADLLRSALVNIQESSSGLTDYVQSLDHDKDRLIEVQDRLGAIDSLKRKYGGSIESILDKELSLSDELKNFNSVDYDIEQKKNRISELRTRYNKIAIELHNLRVDGSRNLAPKITIEMQSLNMPEANFEIRISAKKTNDSFTVFEDEKVVATEKGFDSIQFLLSANPGEALKPLVEIASGGEISRIMLAIKTVFQNGDPIDTLVFDEIDSGISGDAAQKVGQSLLNLSNSKQVICITHLPQIARLAMHHLHIEKRIADGSTKVDAKYLDQSERNTIINHLSSSI